MTEQLFDRERVRSAPNDLTERILQERARLLARPPAEEIDAKDFVDVVTFHAGGEYFGVPTKMVFEIQPLRTLQWARVPCTPAFLIGLINLRGHLYSIMDLSSFLGLGPHPPSDAAHVILVRGGISDDGAEMELTLLADDMPKLQRTPLSALCTPPPTVSTKLQDYTRGVSSEMLMVLDLERLLSDPRIVVRDEI
jgi:purine-binding chemotaxis protein CheW